MGEFNQIEQHLCQEYCQSPKRAMARLSWCKSPKMFGWWLVWFFWSVQPGQGQTCQVQDIQVIVVGAGMSGLAAAHELARLGGFCVKVLEARSRA
eukprot:g17262.t1